MRKFHPVAKHQSAQRGLDVLSTSQTARLTDAAPRLRSRKGPYLVDQTKLGALQARSQAQGGILYSPWDDSHTRPAWIVCGKGRDICTSPVLIVLNSGENEATPMGSAIELHVRCRKCEACQKARRAYWKLRAMAEIGRSSRTWFLTLTWRPEERLRCEYSIKEPSADNDELFRQRCEALRSEVTRYLQRVRKGLRTEGESRVSFRYLQTWESHKDGFPHAHFLIHEVGQTITKRRLQREWSAGFSNARLVECADPEDIHRSAAYVCKYITKSMLGRIPASLHYGASAASASHTNC